MDFIDKQHIAGSRLVSIAARSPARSSTGPEVDLSPTPISVAIIFANVVLPKPGGPNTSVWSKLSSRSLAAPIKSQAVREPEAGQYSL